MRIVKLILVSVIFSFAVKTCEAKIIYQISITNSSLTSFKFILNSKKGGTVLPSQTIIINDSLISESYYTFALAQLEIIYLPGQANKSIPLVIENGSQLNFNFLPPTDVSLQPIYTVTGFAFERNANYLHETFFPKKYENAKWERTEYAKRKNPKLSRAQVDSFVNETLKHRLEYFKYLENYLFSIKDTYLAYHIFLSEFLTPKNILILGKQRVLKTFKEFDTIWRHSSIGRGIDNKLEKIISTSVGSIAPDFRFKTFDFKNHTLYNYIKRDKQVLLIFTSKGCLACKEQIPLIKQIEAELKPNLQVIYVSLDLNKESWTQDFNSGYPGILTLNLKPYNFSVNLQELFMATFIPQVFLIGKDYKILYDNLSPYEDDSLQSLIDLLGLKEG